MLMLTGCAAAAELFDDVDDVQRCAVALGNIDRVFECSVSVLGTIRRPDNAVEHLKPRFR